MFPNVNRGLVSKYIVTMMENMSGEKGQKYSSTSGITIKMDPQDTAAPPSFAIVCADVKHKNIPISGKLHPHESIIIRAKAGANEEEAT